MCRPEADPAHALTFDPVTLKDRITELKKVASPRLKWTELTFRETWSDALQHNSLHLGPIDANSDRHLDILGGRLSCLATKFGFRSYIIIITPL